MIEESFSDRTIYYFHRKVNLFDTINNMLESYVEDSSEYSFVNPEFKDSFFWKEDRISLEELFKNVEAYSLSQGINEHEIIHIFYLVLHYSGSDDIISFCERLRSYNGVIADAITIANRFDKLKNTSSILLRGEYRFKERKDKNHPKVTHIINSSAAEINHSIRITLNNYKRYKNLTKNKILEKIVTERTKRFALSLYYHLEDADKKRETVYNLLKFRGFDGSERNISFDRLPRRRKKPEDYLTYEEYWIAILEDIKLPFF